MKQPTRDSAAVLAFARHCRAFFVGCSSFLSLILAFAEDKEGRRKGGEHEGD